jgi:predicted SAM-dependent methyltransferase
MKLHIGSGNVILDGWINIDEQEFEGVYQMTLPDGLTKFGRNTIDFIYSSHFLEHLSYPDQAREFINHCYRILRPHGVLRTVVPDIESIIRAYARDDNEYFQIQANFHPDWCNTKLDHLMYALQQEGEHKYGYDYETLNVLLTDAGFKYITKSDYNQSLVPDVNVDYRRMTDNHGDELSLFVDAIK